MYTNHITVVQCSFLLLYSFLFVTCHTPPPPLSYECRSPDGSCILSCSNDNKLRLFNLPQSVLQPRDSDQTSVGSPEMVGLLCIPPYVPVVLQSVVCRQSNSIVLPVQHIQQAQVTVQGQSWEVMYHSQGDDDSGHPNQMNRALLMFSNCSHYFSGQKQLANNFQYRPDWLGRLYQSISCASQNTETSEFLFQCSGKQLVILGSG